jgi:hypothetical protein
MKDERKRRSILHQQQCWVCFSLMIDRNIGGNFYLYSSGEMHRQYKEKLMRRHLAIMFSLIKNESLGIEDD